MLMNHFSWLMIVYLLVTTHITILTVTIYLHRSVAHRSLNVAKPLEHFFRFWCWMTTGQSTQEWAAVHRKHHAKCESEEDPHSPRIYGFWTVLFKGVALYRKEAKNPETVAKYGKMCPDDWLETNIYKKHSIVGLVALALAELAVFGVHGIWIYIIQIAWIPFWAAGVINGLGHFKGYRNFNTQDDSTNISPIGLIIGGEELHNNHHAYPTSAKMSMKWYEFDCGWMWIKLLSWCQLVKINKVHRLPIKNHHLYSMNLKSDNVDDTVLDVFLSHRYFVWKMFRNNTKSSVRSQLQKIRLSDETLKKYSVKKLKQVFYDYSENLNQDDNSLLKRILKNEFLKNTHEFKERLWKMWTDRQTSYQQLKENMVQWYEHVSASRCQVMEHFARNLTSLRPQV